MTLETLITFLAIENNNINNYIVTFEKRVTLTKIHMIPQIIISSQTTVVKEVLNETKEKNTCLYQSFIHHPSRSTSTPERISVVERYIVYTS